MIALFMVCWLALSVCFIVLITLLVLLTTLEEETKARIVFVSCIMVPIGTYYLLHSGGAYGP